MSTALADYAELLALSNFSFQQGASHPEELVVRARALGYQALALTDECSVAGVVRAHAQARQSGVRLLPGAVFALAPAEPQTPAHLPIDAQPPEPADSLTDVPTDASTQALPDSAHHWRMVVLPRNLAGWGRLCQYITHARSRARKGQYRADLPAPGSETLAHCEIILLPPRRSPRGGLLDDEKTIAEKAYVLSGKAIFCSENSGLWLGACSHQALDDDWWLMQVHQLSQATGVPVVAVGDVRMHARSRKPLLDVMTALCLHRPVQACGRALAANGQAHLRTRLQLSRLFPPEWLAATLTLAGRCTFSLDELRYRYPLETVGEGETPAQTLNRLVWAGAAWRYGAEPAQSVPAPVRQQIAHELALIAELGYEMYFLTVHDLVRFARSRDILCQGRGSAANSAVCYCLGVTEVDPAQSTLLFERFISRERNEPPDIDVDFEHQRREEVIQYIYAKYGRDRAALTATVISYRPRSALRDVGRALGVGEALVRLMAKEHPGMYSRTLAPERLATALERLRAQAPDEPAPDAHTLSLWLELSQQLMGFPRHLSQHVGGFVLTDGPLTALVPVEPAAMAGRSIIQWDKDDLDAVGLLKVDVLALGMLSALRRSLDLLAAKGLGLPDVLGVPSAESAAGAVRAAGTPGGLDLRHPHARSASGRLLMAAIPKDDEAVYAMVSDADTVGVFQIESRAQMSMLPRLRPRTFYDLVVQVAIVRPGPIQGGMVHPYLRRRRGMEPVVYPSRELEVALGRTLGVPIFQEQVMQVAMLCAGFSAGEADSLRRAMAAWKRKGGVHRFYDRVMSGMLARGYTAAFAQSIFAQIEGFGEYGFPESHAASFALLVYVSAWIKCYHPDVFLAALLNSQPMGFYTPSQLVQDARRHSVVVRPVDVRVSEWDCTLEVVPGGRTAVRLGLRLVSGLGEAAAQRVVAARRALLPAEAPMTVAELARRAQLGRAELDALAAADALAGLAGHRRRQVWEAAGAVPLPGLWQSVGAPDDPLPAHDWPAPTLAQDVMGDYAATGLSLRAHPLHFLRPQLAAMRLSTAAELASYPSGRLARACGIVTVRQQPGTASGVVFVTLEDETGSVNVIVWPALKARQRQELVQSRLMAVYGVWQRDDDTGGQVRHLIAKRLRDLTPLLGQLHTSSRDFH